MQFWNFNQNLFQKNWWWNLNSPISTVFIWTCQNWFVKTIIININTNSLIPQSIVLLCSIKQNIGLFWILIASYCSNKTSKQLLLFFSFLFFKQSTMTIIRQKHLFANFCFLLFFFYGKLFKLNYFELQTTFEPSFSFSVSVFVNFRKNLGHFSFQSFLLRLFKTDAVRYDERIEAIIVLFQFTIHLSFSPFHLQIHLKNSRNPSSKQQAEISKQLSLSFS